MVLCTAVNQCDEFVVGLLKFRVFEVLHQVKRPAVLFSIVYNICSACIFDLVPVNAADSFVKFIMTVGRYFTFNG